MENISKFHIYSLGRVAKDIKEDSLYVDIYPIELQPNKDGDIAKIEPLVNTVEDIYGNIENINVDKTTLIKAKWLPYGNPHKLEPPMVCKGETVLILRYANIDDYFWTTIYNELHLRKLEKHTLILSNKKTITNGKNNLEKSYYVIMDTINKFIRLHTDDSDGERTTFDIEIDTKNGILTLSDGDKNEIILNNKENSITLNTNTLVEVNTKHVVVNCITSELNCVESTAVTCETSTLTCTTSTVECETSTLTCDTSSVKCNSSDLTCDTSSVKCNSSNVEAGTSSIKCNSSDLTCVTSDVKCSESNVDADTKVTLSSPAIELSGDMTNINPT